MFEEKRYKDLTEEEVQVIKKHYSAIEFNNEIDKLCRRSLFNFQIKAYQEDFSENFDLFAISEKELRAKLNFIAKSILEDKVIVSYDPKMVYSNVNDIIT